MTSSTCCDTRRSYVEIENRKSWVSVCLLLGGACNNRVRKGQNVHGAYFLVLADHPSNLNGARLVWEERQW
jgi:hypothetical protein